MQRQSSSTFWILEEKWEKVMTSRHNFPLFPVTPWVLTALSPLSNNTDNQQRFKYMPNDLIESIFVKLIHDSWFYLDRCGIHIHFVLIHVLRWWCFVPARWLKINFRNTKLISRNSLVHMFAGLKSYWKIHRKAWRPHLIPSEYIKQQ